MEIMTILASEGDPEDPGVEVPVLPVDNVSGRPGDEGGNDLDKGGPGGGDPQTGDTDADPEDGPKDTDEFTQMWMRLGLQPDRGQIDVVRSNWRKIEGQIEVIWRNLRKVFIDTAQDQGRISREEH